MSFEAALSVSALKPSGKSCVALQSHNFFFFLVPSGLPRRTLLASKTPAVRGPLHTRRGREALHHRCGLRCTPRGRERGRGKPSGVRRCDTHSQPGHDTLAHRNHSTSWSLARLQPGKPIWQHTMLHVSFEIIMPAKLVSLPGLSGPHGVT